MLYSIEKKTAQEEPAMKPVPLSTLARAGWVEKDLENILAQRIDCVIRGDQLMVISQETRFQEEADILALDDKGTLYIFELKRWQGEQANLLQVIRYGQIFGQYRYTDLEDLFRKYIGEPTASLDEDHAQHFELAEKLKRDSFNTTQRFVVVTAGVDIETLNHVSRFVGFL